MKIIKTPLALLKFLNRFNLPDALVHTVCFVGLLTISPSMALTQEYETDRIFIRQQSKNHCLVNVRDQIREHRKTRDMSDEHNQLINRHVWNRNRTGLEMSQNQQQRLNQLLKGNPGPKYLSARQLMQKRERMYAKMKQNCKDLASQ